MPSSLSVSVCGISPKRTVPGLPPVGQSQVFVRLTDGGKAIDNVALLDYCAEHIPRFAVPRYIEVLDALPKSSTGKIQKEPLRQDGVTEGTWDRDSVGYKIARRV